MYDVFYVSKGKDVNFSKLKKIFPLLKIARYENNIYEAFLNAQRKSLTHFFWLIPEDYIEINQNISLKYEVTEENRFKVHIFLNYGIYLIPKNYNLSFDEIQTKNFFDSFIIDDTNIPEKDEEKTVPLAKSIYYEESPFDEEWFCSLPWTGFSNDPDGKVRPCCLFKDYITQENGDYYYVQKHSVKEIFTSSYMKELRRLFREKKKPWACQVCIKDEVNNYQSKRQKYLEGDIGRAVIYSDEPSYPVEYQMIISNACNLKCRSCTPSHSNLWQAEFKKIKGNTGYEMPHGQSGDKESLLWNEREEWISHLQRLEIVGGEPFYIKQWADIWEELINSGLSKNIIMDMSSNGTIYAGERVERLAGNFKSLGIGLSIDGIGKTYDYLRHPGKWDDVSKNIINYYSLFLTCQTNGQSVWFQFSHTIGWLNAWELPEFHTWVKENTPQFNIWNNIIHSPRHMSVIMIPRTVKDMIRDKWNAYDWGKYKQDIDGIINFMYSEQPSDNTIRMEYQKFTIHDKVRDENILDIIPDELKMLEKYFE